MVLCGWQCGNVHCTIMSVCVCVADDFIPAGPEGIHVPLSPLVGRLFLRFLRVYGSEFTPEVQGVSVRLGGWFPIDRRLATFVDPVVIPDPVDESNNVGRNCFRFQQIQGVLWNAYRELTGTRHPPPSATSHHNYMKALFPKWAESCV